jgi:hypothetical protein
MPLRNAWIVLVSVALYGLGLYGVWVLVSAGKFHWALAAFPCAILGLCVVPFLGAAPRPVTKPEILDEDRTE